MWEGRLVLSCSNKKLLYKDLWAWEQFHLAKQHPCFWLKYDQEFGSHHFNPHNWMSILGSDFGDTTAEPHVWGFTIDPLLSLTLFSSFLLFTLLRFSSFLAPYSTPESPLCPLIAALPIIFSNKSLHIVLDMHVHAEPLSTLS